MMLPSDGPLSASAFSGSIIFRASFIKKVRVFSNVTLETMSCSFPALFNLLIWLEKKCRQFEKSIGWRSMISLSTNFLISISSFYICCWMKDRQRGFNLYDSVCCSWGEIWVDSISFCLWTNKKPFWMSSTDRVNSLSSRISAWSGSVDFSSANR